MPELYSSGIHRRTHVPPVSVGAPPAALAKFPKRTRGRVGGNTKLAQKVRDTGIAAYRIAQEAGMSHGRLYLYTSGRLKVHPGVELSRLCLVLGCEPHELLD